MFRNNVCPTLLFYARQVVHSTHRETVAYIAAGTLLSGQVVVVLRDGGLKHRRAEVGCVAQVLRPGVIREQREPMLITPAHVYISGVIPALCRVLQQVDGADREAHLSCGASRGRSDVGHTRWQGGVRHKRNDRVRSARSDGSGTRRRIVDQMRALQVQAVRAQVADLQSC